MTGLLADWQIRELHYAPGNHPLIVPFEDRLVQPASYELTLSDSFALTRFVGSVDVTDPPEDMYDYINLSKMVLQPGRFVLASSVEVVHLPTNVAARVEGKSSLGRLGLSIHTTAGWIDPGFTGQVTLELKNLGPNNLEIRWGMKIAQLAFFQMEEHVARPYGHPDNGNAYQGQVGATGSVGTRG